MQSLDELLDMRGWLSERHEWLGLDIETEGVNLGRDDVRLCQLGDPQKGYAFAWEDWKGFVKEWLPKYDGKLVCHNAAFEIGFLKREGVSVQQHLVHDTMVMAHLLDPRRTIGLKPVSARRIGPAALMGKDALDKTFKGGGWNWATVPIDHPDYWLYAVMDTMLTAELADVMWPEVQEYRRVYDVEMGCLFTLRDARLKGLLVDLDMVNYRRAELLSELEALKGKFPFRPTRDQEVKAWLSEQGRQRGYGYRLGDWWPFRTEQDAISLDKTALKAFSGRFPDVLPALRDYRWKYRLVHSYFDNILKFNVDGVIRCSIKTLGARTGRMSVEEPALQQLPRGREVRDVFIPREGCKLLLADYSQMEARMFASDAHCEAMLGALREGVDLHAWVSAEVYHAGDLSAVSPEQRQVTKAVNYAKLFGAGDDTTAWTAGVPVSEIKDFQRRYAERFPEVETYMEAMAAEMYGRLHEQGEAYVHTILGRRLAVDKDRLYSAVNYRIQGSGGDVLKLKINELDNAGLGEYIRLPVHDEVVMEVPDEEIDDVRHTVQEVMPEVDLFDLPLTIDTDVVDRWGLHYEEGPRGEWIKGEGWHDAV